MTKILPTITVHFVRTRIVNYDAQVTADREDYIEQLASFIGERGGQ